MQIRWSGERPDIGGVVYSAGRDCVIKVWNPKDGAMLILGFGEVLNLLKVDEVRSFESLSRKR